MSFEQFNINPVVREAFVEKNLLFDASRIITSGGGRFTSNPGEDTLSYEQNVAPTGNMGFGFPVPQGAIWELLWGRYLAPSGFKYTMQYRDITNDVIVAEWFREKTETDYTFSMKNTPSIRSYQAKNRQMIIEFVSDQPLGIGQRFNLFALTMREFSDFEEVLRTVDQFY